MGPLADSTQSAMSFVKDFDHLASSVFDKGEHAKEGKKAAGVKVEYVVLFDGASAKDADIDRMKEMVDNVLFEHQIIEAMKQIFRDKL